MIARAAKLSKLRPRPGAARRAGRRADAALNRIERANRGHAEFNRNVRDSTDQYQRVFEPPGGQFPGPPQGQYQGQPQGQFSGPPQGQYQGQPHGQFPGPPQGQYPGHRQPPSQAPTNAPPSSDPAEALNVRPAQSVAAKAGRTALDVATGNSFPQWVVVVAVVFIIIAIVLAILFVTRTDPEAPVGTRVLQMFSTPSEEEVAEIVESEAEKDKRPPSFTYEVTGTDVDGWTIALGGEREWDLDNVVFRAFYKNIESRSDIYPPIDTMEAEYLHVVQRQKPPFEMKIPPPPDPKYTDIIVNWDLMSRLISSFTVRQDQFVISTDQIITLSFTLQGDTRLFLPLRGYSIAFRYNGKTYSFIEDSKLEDPVGEITLDTISAGLSGKSLTLEFYMIDTATGLAGDITGYTLVKDPSIVGASDAPLIRETAVELDEDP